MTRARGRLLRRLRPAALLAAFAVAACAGRAPSAADTTAAGTAGAEVLAEQAVARLQRRYAQATDLISQQSAGDSSRTRAVYRQIFTEQAEIGLEGQVHVVGPDAWLEVVEGSQRTLRGSQHLIGSQVVDLVELPDPAGAGGRATMTSYLMATQVAPNGALTRVFGTYRSEAVHSRDRGWRLSRMTLSLLAVDGPR